MAFRASNITPADAYQTVKRAANQLKINIAAINAKLAASGADYDYLRDIYRLLSNADAQFTTLKATPGIAAHAKIAEDDVTYDVAAEFTTMQSAIVSAIGWMDANVPTSVAAKSPAEWGEGSLISNTFTAAQTSGLRTQLSAVAATIS